MGQELKSVLWKLTKSTFTLLFVVGLVEYIDPGFLGYPKFAQLLKRFPFLKYNSADEPKYRAIKDKDGNTFIIDADSQSGTEREDGDEAANESESEDEVSSEAVPFHNATTIHQPIPSSMFVPAAASSYYDLRNTNTASRSTCQTGAQKPKSTAKLTPKAKSAALYESMQKIGSSLLYSSLSRFAVGDCDICDKALNVSNGQVMCCIDCGNKYTCSACDSAREHPLWHRVLRLGLHDIAAFNAIKNVKKEMGEQWPIVDDLQADSLKYHEEWSPSSLKFGKNTSLKNSELKEISADGFNTSLFYNTEGFEYAVPNWPLPEFFALEKRLNDDSELPCKLVKSIEDEFVYGLAHGTAFIDNRLEKLFDSFRFMADIGLVAMLSCGPDLVKLSGTFALGNPPNTLKVPAELAKKYEERNTKTPFGKRLYAALDEIAGKEKNDKPKEYTEIKMPIAKFYICPGEPFTTTKCRNITISGSEPTLEEIREEKLAVDTISVTFLTEMSARRHASGLSPQIPLLDIWPGISNSHFMKMLPAAQLISRVGELDTPEGDQNANDDPNNDFEFCKFLVALYDYNDDGFVDFVEFLHANDILYYSKDTAKIMWTLRGIFQFFFNVGQEEKHLQKHKQDTGFCSRNWQYTLFKMKKTKDFGSTDRKVRRNTANEKHITIYLDELLNTFRRLQCLYEDFAITEFAFSASVAKENGKHEATIPLPSDRASKFSTKKPDSRNGITSGTKPIDLTPVKHQASFILGSQLTEYDGITQDPQSFSALSISNMRTYEVEYKKIYDSKLLDEKMTQGEISLADLAEIIEYETPRLGDRLVACADAGVI